MMSIIVRIKDGKWGPPINMGAAVNTVNDDTHFQYYPELKKAVISGIYNFDGYFSYDVFGIDLENTDFHFYKSSVKSFLFDI